MNDLWLKIKIWTKAILFVLVLIYAIVFAVANRQAVPLWVWFGTEYRIAMTLVVLMSLLMGVLGTILVRAILRTIKQMRELKERDRSHRLERELADMKSKAAMLHTRDDATRAERPAPEAPRTPPPAEPEP
jgi:uncharacterized integral membrane protein